MKLRKYLLKLILTALFIVISLILTRSFSLLLGPMFRLSIGTIPIISASLILGPFYGGLVGFGSDLIGATLFPTGSFLIFPMIGQVLYGVLPWIFAKLFKTLQKRIKLPLLYIIMPILMAIPVIYLFTNKHLPTNIVGTSTTQITNTLRFSVTAIIVGLLVISLGLSYLAKTKFFKNKSAVDVNNIALSIFLTQFLVDLVYGTIWKTLFLNTSLIFVLSMQLFIVFALLPLLTIFTALTAHTYKLSRIGE